MKILLRIWVKKTTITYDTTNEVIDNHWKTCHKQVGKWVNISTQSD